MMGSMNRALAATLASCVLLTACSAGSDHESPGPTRPVEVTDSPSPSPTPSRTIGLADARAAVYGLFIAQYNVARTVALEGPVTACGTVTLTGTKGWATVAQEENVTNPEGPSSRLTAWLAWPVPESEIDAVDTALSAASSCTGTEDEWSEAGAVETLAAPFAGPGVRLTATSGDRSRLRIAGRVGHLLVACYADDLTAGDVQGETHVGLAGCMDRAGRLATLAQVPDLRATAEPDAAIMLASRVQLDGMKTYPFAEAPGAACVGGEDFAQPTFRGRVSVKAAGDAGTEVVQVAIEASKDESSAQAALKQYVATGSSCVGDYTPPNVPADRDFHVTREPGRPTATSGGGMAFAATEFNKGQATGYDYAEIFVMGAYKVQVSSSYQPTADAAKAYVEQAIRSLLAVS
jgi:hypothetical protein